jgi:hypothetical protein
MNENSDFRILKPVSSFRLNGKRLFLSYYKINIKREEVLIQLTTIFENNIKEYVIAQEDDKETDEKHIHVYIELKKTINIVSPIRLDLVDPKTNLKIHGRYEVVKNKFNTLNYVKKEDKNYLSNLEEDFNLKLKKIADEKGYDEAISYFCEMKPEKIITDFSSISLNLKEYCASKVKFKS